MCGYIVKPYVYYDERYPSHWIKLDVARRLVSALESVGFEVIDADETKKLMEKAVATRFKEELVIIFSQDVVPEKLVDNPSSPGANSLIRKFLNNGHSIVWMGDIPLLHIGFSKGEKRTLTNIIARQVLGLDPNVSFVNVPVRHTNYGYMFQLPTWIGSRPHKGASGVGFIPLSISSYGVHAFILTYYKGASGHYTLSGFIRIYDMELDKPEKLSDDMIRGIINVVYRNPVFHVWMVMQKLQKRIYRVEEDLKTSFNTLRSELDNLGKILDKLLKLAENKPCSKPQNKQSQGDI